YDASNEASVRCAGHQAVASWGWVKGVEPAKQSGQGGERMPNIVGGCLCGSVRYESEAEPILTAVCHCRHCQKQTSSAFSIFVVLPKRSLRIEGEPLAAFADVGARGLSVLRKFSRTCR